MFPRSMMNGLSATKGLCQCRDRVHVIFRKKMKKWKKIEEKSKNQLEKRSNKSTMKGK
ncbi:hypothetical protein Sjap_012958 [Stephania japonica]|uniref:Uncharacterized protein n=1 Tax=Stephania japonica TaxID=461633 RepID=A0AAP0P0V9_9MAGN